MSTDLASGLPPLILKAPAAGTVSLRAPAPQPATVVPIGPSVGVQEQIDVAFAVHRADPAPHPVYDDLPDLSLIFQNGLV